MGFAGDAALRRNNLDFVRFALATLVIFSHSFPLLQGSNAGEPLHRLTREQLTFGDLAVDWFFVTSGFLITHSLLRSRGLGDFFRKRALRIYPAYVVAVLFGAWVVIPWAGGSTSSWSSLALDLAFLRGHPATTAFAGNPFPGAVNGSLWSIFYEAWCYVGVALLGVVGLLPKRRVVLGIFAASIAASVAFLVSSRLASLGGGLLQTLFGEPAVWGRMLPYYLAGTVFYLYRDRIPANGRLAALALALLVVGARVPTIGVALALPTAGTYLLFWAAFRTAPRLEHWAKHGDFSYGIYLYAFPIQQLLVMQFGRQLQPATLFAIAAPVTFALAIVSWYAVERPFLRLKGNTARAATPAPVEATVDASS